MFGPETPLPKVPPIQVDGWLPVQGSTLAKEIDRGWDAAMWVAVIVFFTVVIPMFYFMFKYKRKAEGERTEELDHSTKMEIGWSVIPLIVVLGLFFIGLKSFVSASVAPRGAYEIRVQAQKWSWTFLYPNGASSSKLVVPKGQPVKLIMSATDVLHSLYIPEFRVKNDVIPGQFTTLWFEATRVGDTALECTEFCGKDHSNMLTTVTVLEPSDFEKVVDGWVKVDVNEETGRRLYTERGCLACHTLDGTVNPGGGPSFKGLYGKTETFTDGTSATVDDNYLSDSIKNPAATIVKGFQPIMPPFGTLRKEEIDSLILFIKAQK
jgi:cytochrome c oxidase subunit 2